MAVGRPWTEYEDQLLTQAISIHGENDNWKLVALSVPGRTNKACRKKWLHSLCPSVKKSAWTREEDELLLSLHAIHSTKWSVIARHIQGRTDDACSKRYREALDPSLKKGGWTSEEDIRLLRAYDRLGGKWGQIGTELSRSGLGCRNRWRLLDRKRVTLSQKPFQYDPRCSGLQSPPSWPETSMLIPNELWNQANLVSHAPGPLCGREHCDVEGPRMRLPTPPPFQFSSSSLSTALSSPDPSHGSTSSQHVANPSPGSELSIPDRGVEQCFSPQLQLNEVNSEPDYSNVIMDEAATYVSNDILIPGDGIDTAHDLAPSAITISEPVIPASVPPSGPTKGAVVISDTSSSTISQIPPGFEAHHPVTAITEVSDSLSLPKKRSQNTGKPKLSSCLPVDSDGTLLAYVCGHEDCFPPDTEQGSVRFMTSKELWDHSKNDHSEAMGGCKPFRCGLDGCGKGWKSINGLQYHLQVSKAHFRQALSTQYLSQPSSSPALPSVSPSPSDTQDNKRRKRYSCPHEGCPNEYRQKSGLRYHLTHGHPSVAPAQLLVVPPALAEKMNKQINGT